MADEYIRKQDVVDYCKALMNAELVQNTNDWGYGKERYNQTEVILVFIENRPPADVAPVVHGHWIRHDDADIVEGYYVPEYECSECKGWVKDDTDFCPNCGALMDAKGEE